MQGAEIFIHMVQREESFRDYLQLIQKHDFTICFSVLLILGTALIISLRLPKTYAASTLMLLVQPASTPSFSSTNLFQTVLSGGSSPRELDTIGTRFSTESMLTAAIENLEEDGNVDAVSLLPSIGLLKQKLKVQTEPDSNYIKLVIELTEEEGGERNASLFVNRLAEDMQTLRSEDEKTKLVRRKQFLDEKRQEIAAELQKHLETVRQFVRENGSPEIWVPKFTNLLEQHSNLQERLEAAQENLYATRSHIGYLKERLQMLPEQVQLSETAAYNPVWLFQQEKLFDLEGQRVADEEKVGKDSSELKGIDAQIENIKKRKEQTPQTAITATSGISPYYTYIQNRLSELIPLRFRYENAHERIKQQLYHLDTELRQLIDKIPENQSVLAQLRAGIDKINALSEEIAKRSLEAEILSAESTMTTSQNRRGGIEIIDRAVPRKIPVTPQLKFIVIIAVLVGLTLGVTIALGIEYVNRTSKNLNED